MHNDRLLSLLGLCRRARRLTIGADSVVKEIGSGTAQLVLYAADFSPGSLKAVLSAAEHAGIPVCSLPYSKEALSLALGKYSGVLCINDKGFARSITALLSQKQNNKEE